MFTRVFSVPPAGRAIGLLATMVTGAFFSSFASGLDLSAEDLIDDERLFSSVKWLADDAREGRMTGSKGGEAAAKWIVERFQEYGLEPGGDDGTFLQYFKATVNLTLGEENELAFDGVSGLGELTAEEDYVPFAFSLNGQEKDLPVVFAGYGITAPELGYDDYEGLDVEGKAVLVMRHEPQQDDEDSPFDGTSHSSHAAFRTKARNAKDHGAFALILFTGPLSEEADEDRLVAPQLGQSVGGSGILAVHVKRPVGETLLQSAGVNAKKWAKKVDKSLQPNSLALDPGTRVRVGASVVKDRRSVPNVVGILRGSDPAAGAVMIGGHYDHLGHGHVGTLSPSRIGEIHNGADDNASGTATVVELARVFSEGEPMDRTLVFAAFTGEELGLFGSAYMASNPPVPLEDIRAMINLDMVGRVGKKKELFVSGVGTSPRFPGLIEDLDEASELELTPSESGFGPSDHTSFYVKDIPVLFFFSGLHRDYHRPSDDVEKIDREGLAEVARLVHTVATDLAGESRVIEFTRADVDKDTTPHTQGVSTGQEYGPYLGTIPDFGEYEGGVKLSGVRGGSPAEVAGIRAGDVILRFGGRDIDDLYEYTHAVGDRKPGDLVEIVLLRGNEEVTVEVVLGTRK